MINLRHSVLGFVVMSALVAVNGGCVTIETCCCCPHEHHCDHDDPGGNGDLPDLIVRSIDTASIDVDCPTGAGSCVTTVTFKIENIGAGVASAPFNVRITLDPAQSVVVNQAVASDMAPGDTRTFTISTPPGGNCFDPDCTVCVEVDSGGAVSESNETNNLLCVTKQG